MIEFRSTLDSSPLFRAIDEPYATDFLAGRIRLTEFREYRKKEYGARSDATKHHGEIIIRGADGVVVHYGLEPVWPVYVLCMYANGGRPDAFASCGLRIDDPNQLARDLAGAVSAELPKQHAPMLLLAGPAEYDKGEAIVDERPDPERRTWIATFQKPQCYAIDRESRIAIAARGAASMAPTHINVDFGRALDYVRRL